MNLIFSFTEIMDRVRAVAGVRQDVEIAALLETDNKKFAVWKSRGFVPLDAICAWCDTNDISINFVLYGHGSIHIANEDGFKKISPEDEIEITRLQNVIYRLLVERSEQLDDIETAALKKIVRMIERF